MKPNGYYRGMINMISDKALKPVLAAQVKRLRRKAGMSQEVLAELVGVDRGTINRIEQQHRVPNAALLYALADVFHVSTDELRQLSEQAGKKMLARS